MTFKNRHDAGAQLVPLLQEYRDTDTVVFALPRGGVVPGYEIATALNLPLDLVITRKIGYPGQPECAIAAVSENGTLLRDESICDQFDAEWFERVKTKQMQEAKRRRECYKDGLPVRLAKDKTVILVDDGIATGLTIRLAYKLIQEQQPKKCILAVPVVAEETAQILEDEGAEVISLLRDHYYRGGVGAYYANFAQVDDEEVSELLKKANT